MGLFSTIAAIGGKVLGGVLANKGAKSAAAKQMAFQKQSATHGYQWAVADMKKAGINPMLAYQQGGASALSGASFRPENVIGPAVNSALDATRLGQELDNMTAMERKTNQETKTARAVESAQLADAALKVNSAKNVAMQTQLMAAGLPQKKTFEAVDKSLVGKASNWIGRLLQNSGISVGGRDKNYRREYGVKKR